MADLTITAANVVSGAAGIVVDRSKVAGESITAGQPVYVKSTDGKLYKAKSSGTPEEATATGIALHAAGAGQPLAQQTAGPITIGGTVVAGTSYCISSTYGGIAPVADLASTNRVTLLGYGISATQIQLTIQQTGVQVP